MQTTLSINYEYDERSMEDLISYKDSYESIEINDLIKDLTYEEKKVFMYKYIEGYNQSEIAKMMHTSQSSVSRFENSGIKKVRKKTY